MKTPKRGNDPTDRQLAFLRELGESGRPRTKEEASAMIDAAIGHWNELFSEEFPGWHSVPRILTRRLQVHARRSRFDEIVEGGDSLKPEELQEIVDSAIGSACAHLLSRELDEFDLANGIGYVEASATAAGIRFSSPLYHCAIAGLLCQAGLQDQLFKAGMDILTAEPEEKDAELKILRRRSELNSMISELLGDRKLRGRVQKIDPSRSRPRSLVFRGFVGLIAVGFGGVGAMVWESKIDASRKQSSVAEVTREEPALPGSERATGSASSPRGTTVSDAIAEAVAEPETLIGLRQWESADGRTMSAALVDVVRGSDGKFVGKFLRNDGRAFDLPLGKLSPEGVADVKAAMVAAGLWHEDGQ